MSIKSNVTHATQRLNFNQIIFYAFPIVWLALIAGLLLLNVPIHQKDNMKHLFNGANLFFFGFTHVGATYYFLISDSLGKAWWKSLESKRKTQLISTWLLSLAVCASFFFLKSHGYSDISKYLYYFNVWTAWHAFRQSESLFFTIDRNERNQKILKAFRVLFILYALFTVVLGQYRSPQITFAVSAISVAMISTIVYGCFQNRNYKSLIFSLRFYFWALQWAEPILAIGTFAIHGVEYLCINKLVLNKMKTKFILHMLMMSGLFLMFVYNDKFSFSYLILVLYYFANMAHYIVDKYIYQYRFEFERTHILNKLNI